MILQKKIRIYISKNYDKIFNLALKFTKNKNKAESLCSCVCISLLESKITYLKFSNSFKENFFIYIYGTMKNQIVNKYSRYNKEINPNTQTYLYFDEILDEEPFWWLQKDFQEDDDILYQIYEFVNSREFNREFPDGISAWFHKEIWKMYYRPETMITKEELKDLTTKEVYDIRKTSYRKISKEFKDVANIDLCYTTIRNVVLEVNSIIKTKLKNRLIKRK